MSSTMRCVVLLIAVGGLAATPQTCEAGRFWDWLTGRPTQVQYAPTTVGYFPAGAYYAEGSSAAYYRAASPYVASQTVTANYAPTTYSPGQFASAAAYAPYPVAAQPSTTFYRAPRTAYYRAPVTTYYRAATPTTTAFYPTTTVPAASYPAASYPAASYPAASYPATTTNYRAAPGYRRGLLGLFNWPVTAVDGIAPSRPYLTESAAAPRTSFRPRWQRVPVTYFRPVTQVDPVTGQQVQRMEACTTYRWQVQQSPTIVQHAPSGAWMSPADCPPGTTYSAPAESGWTRADDDPYYDDRNNASDSGLIPRDAEILRDERVDPADDRPRLEGRPQASEMGSTRGNVDRSSRPAGSTRLLRPQTPPSRPDREKGLLPDPEEGEVEYPTAPPLLRHQDRTAAAADHVRVVTYAAQWPARSKPAVQRLDQPLQAIRDIEAPASDDVPAPPRKRLNDRGWKSLRP